MLIAGAVLWLVVYGWPLAAVLRRSITGVAGRDGLSWATWSVLTEDRIVSLFGFTLAQTAASVAVVCALGVPMGWALARLSFPGRAIVDAVVMVPFVLPTLTVASAVAAAVGGLPESNAARFALIVAAHVCLNLGLMVRSVSAAVAAVPLYVEESAQSLGRGAVRSVRDTTLKLIRPQIINAALLVSMFCLTSFGVIVALGSASVSTIEVEVWFLSTRSLDLASAAVLVIAQLAVILVLIIIQGIVSSRATPRVASLGVRRRSMRRRSDRVLALFTVVITAVVAGGPLVALVIRSLRTSHGWGLGHYRTLFDTPPPGMPGARTALRPGDVAGALGYSVAGAGIATIVALLLAAPLVVAASRDGALGRIIDRLLIVPMCISAATLGLGFLLAYSAEPLDLRGTWIVVPLVQAATAAPVAARLLLGSVRSLDHSPFEAAAMLGAGRVRRWFTIGVPLLGRPVAVAAGFAFAMAIGEFGATVFLARNDAPTVPILISRLIGRAGPANFGAAMALSVILAAIVVTMVAVVGRRADSDLS